jgi:hypothetical protein
MLKHFYIGTWSFYRRSYEGKGWDFRDLAAEPESELPYSESVSA